MQIHQVRDNFRLNIPMNTPNNNLFYLVAY
jgi:hypothetical protein